MDLEAPSSIRDGNSGNIYTGYFKAPADAAYRFYMTLMTGVNSISVMELTLKTLLQRY